MEQLSKEEAGDSGEHGGRLAHAECWERVMDEQLCDELGDAVHTFRVHMGSSCSRCFQGIFCPDKHRLQIAVCDAERAIKDAALLAEEIRRREEEADDE